MMQITQILYVPLPITDYGSKVKKAQLNLSRVKTPTLGVLMAAASISGH